MYVCDKMRDSKLPWLKEIPTHWRITRMKEILQNVSEKNHPDAIVLSLYREHGVLPKDSRDDNHNVTSLDTASYKFVRVGELVINKMKAWQGSLGVSDYEGIVSPAYYVCKFKSNDINKKYFHYLVRCKLYAQEFERLSTGMRVGQWDLSIDDFMATKIIIPPVPEQSAIVAYLDDQISQIDSIIAETKTSIEEYKQWKASIIFEAVTKGLDPDVEMRNSGVDWIGVLPNNWKISRIKNLGTARNGLTYSPANQTDEGKGTLVIRSSNIRNGKFVYDDNIYVSMDIPNEMILKKGDIVICSRNGSRNLVGKNAYFNSEENVSFGAFMMVYRVPYEISEYMYWVLNSGLFNYYLPLFFTSTINQLTRGNFNEMKVPFCPNESDRIEIVAFLKKRCAEIDEIIEIKNNLITDLEQYKSSLIYEVVTGKRKVV